MKNLSLTVSISLFLCNALCAKGNTLYVSNHGSDSSVGSKGSPLLTIGAALKRVNEGDVIELAPGTYREVIELHSKHGITIRAAESGTVKIDPTKRLPKKWELEENGIWSLSYVEDIWQLFCDTDLVYLARWPDATFEDGKIWRMMESCRSTDGGYNHHKGEWEGLTRVGLVYDDQFHIPARPGFTEGDSRYVFDPDITFTNQPPSLASTGIDFSGALAVLNIAHWLTYTQPIVSHDAGSDHFTYSTELIGHKNSELKHFKKRFASYHILGLPALDQCNEWWYDQTENKVYYKPELGANPNELNLYARSVDFAVELAGCSSINFENIDFFAGGFYLNYCTDSGFDTCRFDYPSTHKFVLGAFNWFANHNPRSNPNKMSSYIGGKGNYFLNSVIHRSNAPVAFDSDGVLIENSLFSDIEWQVNSNGGSGSVMFGKNAIFRRNTLLRGGNCEGIRAIGNGSVIELNRVTDSGNLQHDGSAINVGTTKHAGTRVAYNWSHDTNGQGIRFDYHGELVFRPDGKVYGDGVYMNNVSWNTMTNQIKGDRHLVLNNTVINSSSYPVPDEEKVTLAVQGFRSMHGIMGNTHSLTRNNIATIKNRSWNLDAPGRIKSDGYAPPLAAVIPGKSDSNMLTPGASWIYLRDPKNYDFRPKEDSPLIDSGARVKREDLPSAISNYKEQNIIGYAPDMGAYEYGASRYWIPGRKTTTASSPVPKDGGKDVPLNADLMFLEAYNSTHHRILLGESPDSLVEITQIKNLETNIVTPEKLKPETTYYWRVDAHVPTAKQAIQTGDLWHFSTSSE